MLKFVFRFLLTVFFVWALASPFFDSLTADFSADDPASDKQAAVKQEKPLHDVVLPDFAQFVDVKEKKRAFFNFIRPHIEAENKVILQQRAKLEIARMMLEFDEPLSNKQRIELEKILQSYKLPNTVSALSLTQALQRVDIIPKELALMQAANESAWGTSRFARIGLNFFGQWCYSKGCGMVPKRRDAEAAHEVAAFKSVRAAVQSYFRNINTHAAYAELRTIRAELRRQQQPIAAIKLSAGLMSYSERGAAYIEELNKMIEQNKEYFNE
ncbi:glucosaminidase domain-containing protein [Pseudoalteromonas mariniglutinosa]|uniref:glucosaminidase domain-containing protein n=1 Tax=Pseudoalteromonas mariniglutinosa TaxID=206042 RepID=UPI0038502035